MRSYGLLPERARVARLLEHAAERRRVELDLVAGLLLVERRRPSRTPDTTASTPTRIGDRRLLADVDERLLRSGGAAAERARPTTAAQDRGVHPCDCSSFHHRSSSSGQLQRLHGVPSALRSRVARRRSRRACRASSASCAMPARKRRSMSASRNGRMLLRIASRDRTAWCRRPDQTSCCRVSGCGARPSARRCAGSACPW